MQRGLKSLWNYMPMASVTSSSCSLSFVGSRETLKANSCRTGRRMRSSNFNTVALSRLGDGSNSLLQAAKYTVDKYVSNGMVVGLGSGLASGMAIQYLGRQLRTGALKDILGIPIYFGLCRSFQSASEAAKAGIPMDQYEEISQIDFAFDDADIIEKGTLVAVIGRRTLQGGESIIQEKAILNAASKLVFMINENQYRDGVDGSIPVLIQSLNWMETAEEIDDMFLGDAEVWRRSSIGQAGPTGGDFPHITKEGHNILDVIFTSPINSLAEVAESLHEVNGVVDHGVVSRFPCIAVIACESGGLNIVDKIATNDFAKFQS